MRDLGEAPDKAQNTSEKGRKFGRKDFYGTEKSIGLAVLFG